MVKTERIDTKTALASALGVNRGTLYAWIERGIIPDGPPWILEEVKAAVEKYHERQEEAKPGADLKEEKLRLECERLIVSIRRERELLAQAEIETAKQRGELVPLKEIMGEFRAVLDEIRRTVESWAQHETAKHPETAAVVETLRDTLFRAISERAGGAE